MSGKFVIVSSDLPWFGIVVHTNDWNCSIVSPVKKPHDFKELSDSFAHRGSPMKVSHVNVVCPTQNQPFQIVQIILIFNVDEH